MSEIIKFQTNLQKLWGYPAVKLREKVLINNALEDTKKYESINYIDLSSINKENGNVENIKKIHGDFPSRARQKVYDGDLLVSTLSGSMKAIAIIDSKTENMIASTGFFVIRHTSNLLKNFLMFILRTNLFQELLKRESSGAIMASINQSEFLNLKIPLPPIEIQEQIAKEISQRREKAKALQIESKAILESAKKEVEKMILGG
ncbi:restriction endonuclease subunit S [Helicobacter sp. MIT 11-5569]|uniref:restriction endonuclease subunit S n=1 Tax=Helicobacter sp. MIT 11-5569 TaxID=1548151 RepID=UPI00068B399C|nr:restriction endonuclease subunit S [Helicobacter sp. MIT 11-5569]TLD84002.1 restriction endonuclease subunit S [Helicobacter sp. MIT 11-5569]